MVKVRPVVVISPRLRNGQLITVVPIGSSPPAREEPWHYRLPEGAYPPARGPVWVKADIVATVALSRLDRVMVRGRDGGRAYHIFWLSSKDMECVVLAVKAGLGFT